MRVAKLHTRAPQSPSPALDAYRKAMRAKMREAHAAGVSWLALKIARARDVPDGEHLLFMMREAAPLSAEVEATMTRPWIDMHRAAVRIAAACVLLMKGYLLTLPRAPKRQPPSGEKVATYPRPQTVRRRERQRMRRHPRKQDVAEPESAPPCRMWRTRPARPHLAERRRQAESDYMAARAAEEAVT